MDSSSSESDSEEFASKPESDSSDPSDSSDSDGLESWMILGRGKQDGDQSISLNLEQLSDSNAGVTLFTCGLIYLCELFFSGYVLHCSKLCHMFLCI